MHGTYIKIEDYIVLGYDFSEDSIEFSTSVVDPFSVEGETGGSVGGCSCFGHEVVTEM
jgi:hypothetical protein